VVARGQVGVGVECGSAGEKVRVTGDEQERLLAAHARPDRVDPILLDPEPRERPLDPGGHSGEIVDRAVPSPGVAREHPALPLRADDRERPERGQTAPEAEVVVRGDPAAVRGDHQRDRRITSASVPAGNDDERRSTRPIPRVVRDDDRPDQPSVVGDQVAVVVVKRLQTGADAGGSGMPCGHERGPRGADDACRGHQGEGGRDCPGEPRGSGKR